MLRDNCLCGALEIARTAVVAESLPELHQGVVIAGGEVGDGRQCIEEAQIVGTYDGGPRLLEHDLRDPDVIGCRLIAPRQIARVGCRFAPCKKRLTEGREDAAACPG